MEIKTLFAQCVSRFESCPAHDDQLLNNKYMCLVCNGGHPMCPACSSDPEFEECERCKGRGLFYIDDYGNEYHESSSELSDEQCPDCNGEGRIIINYENR